MDRGGLLLNIVKIWGKLPWLYVKRKPWQRKERRENPNKMAKIIALYGQSNRKTNTFF
jgi:hypothetical protein